MASEDAEGRVSPTPPLKVLVTQQTTEHGGRELYGSGSQVLLANDLGFRVTDVVTIMRRNEKQDIRALLVFNSL